MRAYQPEDLAAMLRFVAECLDHDALVGYHPGDIVHWMSNGYRGENLDKHFFLYEQRGELLAVADCSAAKEQASFTLIVHPDIRGTALEKNLIAECEAFMRERLLAITNASLTTNVAIAKTDHRDCLAVLGFGVAASTTVVASRSLDAIPEPALSAGFSIRSALDHEADKLAELDRSAFGSSWTAQDYAKIMTTPGFDINKQLLVLTPGGRFAAVAIFWPDPVTKSGLFEPVGCHKDFRRQGLTSALMYEGMKRMKACGLDTALVGYDRNNIAALKLYESLGFKELFETVDYQKQL